MIVGRVEKRAWQGKLVSFLVQALLVCALLDDWAQAERPGTDPDGTARQAAPLSVTGGPDLPSVIVVPRDLPNDERLTDGCWVRFFKDKSYRGRSLTLLGPVEMPKIYVPGGFWIDWGSAVVGLGATVTTFDYEQFKNRTAVLHPGQQIPDLRARKLGLFEDIHSVRIACKP